MPINKYDQAAQAQFINTYVPIPFEEMVMAGKQKQDRYDRAAGAVDSAIAAAEEITAIPFSADELRAKEYVAKMRDIRDKYANKDISDPFVLREMSNELHRSVNKEDIKHIQQSYQGYLGYQKGLAANELQGRPTPEWARQRFEGYDSSSKGVFTGNAAPQLDPYKDTSDFMKQMDMTRKADVDLAPGVKAIRYSKDADEITKHAKDNLEAFMMLPSIQQYISGIKANGAAGDRTDEQIALDFVEKNKRQWQGEKLDPYNIPGAGQEGYNPNYRNPVGREVLAREAQKDNKSSVTTERDWENVVNELSTAAKNGDVHSKNKLMFLNKIDNSFKSKSMQEQDEARSNRLPDLYSKAESIFKQKGKSTEEARKFVNSFISQSNIEDLLKNEKYLLRADIDKVVDTNLELAFEDKIYETLGETYSPVKTDYLGMKDLLNSTKDLLREQFSISKTNKELALQSKNSILPTQETYTTLGNDYLTDSSDRVLYQYRDQKGSLQSAPSAIWSSLKDFMSQPGNYEKLVFRVDGKEVTKPDKIRNMINSGQFSIDGIYSNPSGSGQPRVMLSMYDKDAKTNKKFKSGEVEVKLPSDLLDNSKNYYEELMSMGKPNLAFNLAYRIPIADKINNNDWEKYPIKVVKENTDGDKLEVVFNKKDYTFSIKIIQNDGTVTNLQKGVEFNELPGLAADEWYSNTE